MIFLGSRGGSRRGGPPYDAAGRGRSQRFNKFEGQGPSSTNESTSFEQGGDAWSTETGTRGARGRGGPRRGNFEGGRGTGGRGRGGRGNFNNRSQEEGSQQENSGWQRSTEYVKLSTTSKWRSQKFPKRGTRQQRKFLTL